MRGLRQYENSFRKRRDVTSAKYLLEHFYYGQVLGDNGPKGDLQLLAKSAGLNDQMVKHAVERVNVPPLIRSENGAWALARGRSRQMPFIMAQAQQGDDGEVVEHYIVLQTDALKAVGGNLRALRQLTLESMPVYKAVQTEALAPLELAAGDPLTIEDQIDDILELMMVTKNRAQLIEPMLAALVEGVQPGGAGRAAQSR